MEGDVGLPDLSKKNPQNPWTDEIQNMNEPQ